MYVGTIYIIAPSTLVRMHIITVLRTTRLEHLLRLFSALIRLPLVRLVLVVGSVLEMVALELAQQLRDLGHLEEARLDDDDARHFWQPGGAKQMLCVRAACCVLCSCLSWLV